MDLLQQIYEKELAVAARTRGKLPYTAKDGVFDDMSHDVPWWTNGFYAGLMWQLYNYKRADVFRDVALFTERKLDRVFARGMDHDSGFRYLPTAGAHYLIRRNRASGERLLRAANDLAGRFNPAGNFIRAWNDGSGENAGWAIIDCMMNLPLLYRASEMSHDPRFKNIALLHAETAEKYFVRPDGSCAHIAVFDPATGKFMGTLGGQGMAEGSAWTRGQAWAIYGFALSYRHTGRTEFLETAERVASYFRTHVPKTGVVPADFMQAEDCPFEDDSASAVAACGFLELHRITKKREYLDAANLLLNALSARADLSAKTDPILTRCTVAYGRDCNIPLVYADYFFVEALLKLRGKELFIW